jgi:hypothetical protein
MCVAAELPDTSPHEVVTPIGIPVSDAQIGMIATDSAHFSDDVIRTLGIPAELMNGPVRAGTPRTFENTCERLWNEMIAARGEDDRRGVPETPDRDSDVNGDRMLEAVDAGCGAYRK